MVVQLLLNLSFRNLSGIEYVIKGERVPGDLAALALAQKFKLSR